MILQTKLLKNELFTNNALLPVETTETTLNTEDAEIKYLCIYVAKKLFRVRFPFTSSHHASNKQQSTQCAKRSSLSACGVLANGSDNPTPKRGSVQFTECWSFTASK